MRMRFVTDDLRNAHNDAVAATEVATRSANEMRIVVVRMGYGLSADRNGSELHKNVTNLAKKDLGWCWNLFFSNGTSGLIETLKRL